jgi:surfactin synthase thioesterase subunit
VTTHLDATAWLEHRYRMPNAERRMFCFPFAGGSAAFYYEWGPAFGPSTEVVPVQLPGRGRLAGLPHARDIRPLAYAAADAIATTDLPVVLFGHSMGAIVAFEVARLLPDVRHLIVTGRPAPHIPRPTTPVSSLSRAELVSLLRDYGATPDEVLADPELLDLVLPTIRADFAMIERYRYVPSPPLTCPLTAVGGLSDPGVSPDDITAWDGYTTAPFTTHFLPGGHFFPITHGADLRALVRAAL